MSIFGGQQMTMYNYGARMPQQPANAAPIVYNNNSTQPQGMAAVYAAMGLQPGTRGTAPSQPAQSMAQAYAERGLAAGVSGQSPTSGASASSSISGAADANAAYRAQFSQSPVQTTVADPNQQYRDNFSSGVVQTTTPTPTNDPNADYRATFTQAPVQAAVATYDPNAAYREYYSQSPVQTVAPQPAYEPLDLAGYEGGPGISTGGSEMSGSESIADAMARLGISPGMAVGEQNQTAAGLGNVAGETMADAMARLGVQPGTAVGEQNQTAAGLGSVSGETMADAMARLGLQPGTAVGDFNQGAAGLSEVSTPELSGATAQSAGTGVATPYSTLGFDDALKVGTGTPVGSTLADRAAATADQALLDRVRAGKLVNTETPMVGAAEQNVLDRLAGNQLGSSADLDSAMVAARNRLANSGVTLDTDLTNQAQQVIMDRLMGGSNPLVEQQRADFLERSRQQQEQLRENLNRMGVLRSGDTAEALGDFIGSRERTLNDINALGYDLQTQALADALNFEGRRDNLRLANEDLARAAIGDVAGLASQYDQRTALESGLAGDAVSQALGLQSRRDQMGIVDQEMQRQALTDVYGRQGQLSALETDRLNRQLAMDDASRAERGVQSDLVTADLQRRLSLAGDERAAQALGSDLTGAAQQRALAGRADLRAQQALGSDLATASQQRALASVADQRAGRALDSDLITQDLQRRLSQAADLRATQALGSDLTGAAQQRALARSADMRAGQALQSDLTTQDLQRRLSQAADLRATQALGSDLTGAAQSRQLAASADQRAADALRSDLVTQDLQRRLAEAGITGQYFSGANQPPVETLSGRAMGLEEDLARANDLRAQQQLESILFGQVQTGADSPIQTIAGQQAADDLQTQQLNRNLAMSDNARRTQLAQQDILNAIAGRGLQSAADQRAAQALSSDLSTADLQRRLSEADATGDFYARGYGQAPTTTLRARALDQDIAASQGAENRAERALTSDIVAQDLQNRLAQADRTGQLEFGGSRRPETTLQARRDAMTQSQLDAENETQRISQILAALDPALTGVRRDLRPFAQELAGQINPDLASALGLSTNTPVSPAATQLAQDRGLTIQPDGTAIDADGNVFRIEEEDGIEDWRPVSG